MVARLWTRGYTNVLSAARPLAALSRVRRSGPPVWEEFRVQETGVRNGAYGADKFGFKDLAAVHWNLTEPALYEHAIARRRSHAGRRRRALRRDRPSHRPLAEGQAHRRRRAHREFGVVGRQPQDVEGELRQCCSPTSRRTPKARSCSRRISTAAPIRSTGSRPASSPNYAWHSLFIRQLLIRPERAELANFVPELTIVDLPSFRPDAKRHGGREGSDTMVAIDFTRKIVLICGSSYAGEMKKSVFTTLNFYLPAAERRADALLGQCQPRRRERAVLRPVRHRQDHAVGRSEPHPDRRRRARLGPGRHLQFRGRLLRQVHQALARKPSR